MYSLDTKALHRDVLKRLNEIKKPQRFLDVKSKKIVSRSTLHRLNTGKPIQMETYFKLIEWLDKEPTKYIKYKPKNRESEC